MKCAFSGGMQKARTANVGAVLIIVLWVAFGLVSMVLYFGHTMVMQFRASEQNSAGIEAEQATEGAIRYISYMLTNSVLPGEIPPSDSHPSQGVMIGDAAFWLIGRSDRTDNQDIPTYGLVDECSKLNLNTATRQMLEFLPGMTYQLAGAIIDWRDSDSEITDNGAESEVYQRLTTPYLCKNAAFETVEELHLVYGGNMDVLYGEDVNLNGVLDLNENDGLNSPPTYDNRDGRLDSGVLEYLTIYSREPDIGTNGSARISVNSIGQSQLSSLMQETFGQQRANAIQAGIAGFQGNIKSLLEFYIRSGMSIQEFEQIASEITVTNATVPGLVNVNTASAAVLSCIPGIGTENAEKLVNYRRGNQSTNSIAWVAQVLDQTNAITAGPYLTTRSFQFSADIVAMGRLGKGFRRTFVVFDVSDGKPKVIFRRDRSRLGWALGSETRQPWLAGKELR